MKDWRTVGDGSGKRHLYYASREWAALREAVRRRSGGTCERCRNAPGENVHHQTYERLYAESIGDLVHLCRPCHEFISAKSDHDPLRSRPVVVCGREVRTVYLAGKVDDMSWRPEGAVLNGPVDFESRAAAVPCAVRLGDGRELVYTGPFVSRRDCKSPHRSGGSGHSGFLADPYIVAVCRDAICTSDLFFAWVDSEDCFGTIAEIGYARGVRCPCIFIAGPREIAELWFVYMMADGVYLDAADPRDALDRMIIDDGLLPAGVVGDFLFGPRGSRSQDDDAPTLLAAVRAAGLVVTAAGGELTVRGPKGASGLVRLLLAHKGAVLDVLKREESEGCSYA